MKTLPEISNSSILIAIMLFVLFLMAVFVILWLIFEYGKRQLTREMEYEKLYENIQGDVFLYDVTTENYQRILAKLKILSNLRWKNHEKTTVLTCTFLKKFAVVRMNHAIDKMKVSRKVDRLLKQKFSDRNDQDETDLSYMNYPQF